jgi:hypothetical protein
MIVAYLIIGFVIGFLVYKKRYEAEVKKSKASPFFGRYDVDIFESAMIAVSIGATWLISVPVILAWRLMDWIYNKYNKPNNEQ